MDKTTVRARVSSVPPGEAKVADLHRLQVRPSQDWPPGTPGHHPDTRASLQWPFIHPVWPCSASQPRAGMGHPLATALLGRPVPLVAHTGQTAAPLHCVVLDGSGPHTWHGTPVAHPALHLPKLEPPGGPRPVTRTPGPRGGPCLLGGPKDLEDAHACWGAPGLSVGPQDLEEAHAGCRASARPGAPAQTGGGEP